MPRYQRWQICKLVGFFLILQTWDKNLAAYNKVSVGFCLTPASPCQWTGLTSSRPDQGVVQDSCWPINHPIALQTDQPEIKSANLWEEPEFFSFQSPPRCFTKGFCSVCLVHACASSLPKNAFLQLLMLTEAVWGVLRFLPCYPLSYFLPPPFF